MTGPMAARRATESAQMLVNAAESEQNGLMARLIAGAYTRVSASYRNRHHGKTQE
ncbi:hypothetical protein [Paracoccus sp. (in: a-proteobacteria)]|uniref:hypothetical protein n=1 Tax=Paracoccus sp. TaxID=267 RepID=UPI003A8A506D